MEEDNKKIIEDSILLMLDNGLVIKCKKEDIPSILSSNRED